MYEVEGSTFCGRDRPQPAFDLVHNLSQRRLIVRGCFPTAGCKPVG